MISFFQEKQELLLDKLLSLDQWTWSNCRYQENKKEPSEDTVGRIIERETAESKWSEEETWNNMGL